MAALKRQALFWIVVVVSLLIRTADAVKGSRRPRKNRFCDPNKHKYYHTQWGRCKRCDKCPRGFGLEEEDVPMNSLHGAMSCKRCRPCIYGISFNNRESYRSCKECRNCTAIGQIERQVCTVEQNTQCVLLSNAEQHVANETITHSEAAKPKRQDNPDIKAPTIKETKEYFWVTAIVVLILAVICATSVVTFRRKIQNCLRHGRSDRKDEHEMDKMVGSLAHDSVPPVTGNVVTALTIDSSTDRMANNDFKVSREIHLDTDNELEDQLKSFAVNETTVTTDGSCTSLNANREGPVTQKKMLRIATELAKQNKAFALGAALDIDHSTVELIQDENKEPDEALFKLLVKWSHLRGKNANRRVLSEALITIGCPDLIAILTC